MEDWLLFVRKRKGTRTMTMSEARYREKELIHSENQDKLRERRGVGEGRNCAAGEFEKTRTAQ